VDLCRTSEAHLATRERLFLYALVYSVATRHVLEIGAFQCGSAMIISGALDDLGLGRKLVTMDPNLVQIRCDRDALAHNVTFVEGYFTKASVQI
jgi:predicted O-methyltransferase YrrM